MERVRTGPPPLERPGSFEIALPATHSAYAFVQERLARQGAKLADTNEVMHRRADDPVLGDVALAHPDERAGIRQEKVLGMYSHRPGYMPTLILAPSMDYAERLKEMLDEHFHYGGGVLDRDREGLPERPNVKEHHVDALDQYRAFLKGQTVNGPRPKARHLQH